MSNDNASAERCNCENNNKKRNSSQDSAPTLLKAIESMLPSLLQKSQMMKRTQMKVVAIDY